MYLAPQPVPSGTESNGTHDQAKGGHLATSPRAAALGLLRSYAYLIKGELDFIYAVEAHLIPEGVDWVQWKRFIHHFISVEDQSVAKRYHYGQLRLSRLDWAVRLFRPRSRKGRTRWIHYEPSHQGSLTRLFERATVPLAFLIAGVSVLLSAMQVALGTGSIGEQLPGVNFDAMRASFWLVSMFIMGGCAVATLLFIILPTSVVTWQLVWGYKQKGDAEEMCSIRREEYLA
jgi:hypothetical protein